MNRCGVMKVSPVKLGIISLALSALASVVICGAILTGPQTKNKEKLILRLYDLNCSAPFPTYRYPRTVMWLATGDPLGRGEWKTVFKCR
jgi:hypothetical protein